MPKDNLQLNPRSFEEAIRGNTGVETLLSRVYFETVRSADHINSYRTNQKSYVERYPQFTSRNASDNSPMTRLEDGDFRLAKQVVSAFTIVCAPPVRQPGDNQFHQVDYRTSEKTALRVGQIGEDEIVIVDGQILLRRDALTTRPLTVAEINQHAQEIETAVKPSRLKRLTTVSAQAEHVSWSAFGETYSPLEKEISEAQRNTPQQSKEERVFTKFDEVKNALIEQMLVLEQVAAGKPWQEIPVLVEANEAISAEEAQKALAEIKGGIAGTLLESNDKMGELLTRYGFQEEAKETRDSRNDIIAAIAKSLQ